jgi:hypothetical protein
MTDDTSLPFSFPAVHTKKVTAAFDGGRLTSNAGVLAMAERCLGLADKLAQVFPDRRDPTRVVHSLVDMFRARMFAICCGYEDPTTSIPCGPIRHSSWPADSGRELCSQPTLSRLENSPRLRDVIRLTYTLVDAWMDSYPRERRIRHPGHRRHLRCRPPVAAVLRPRQDAGRRRGACPSSPSGTAHPHAMAQDANSVPRRRALRSAGGDDVVREQRHTQLADGFPD